MSASRIATVGTFGVIIVGIIAFIGGTAEYGGFSGYAAEHGMSMAELGWLIAGTLGLSGIAAFFCIRYSLQIEAEQTA